ncbi:MAG: cytosine permease [Acidobacteria bacterium]|nr:cytosine permease [Acidobacteriota bacterium]
MKPALPNYVTRAVPVAQANRVPWYKSTFPTYAGIFLWVGFYLQIAGTTLRFGSIGVCIAGLIVAALLCFVLFYYAPASLGRKTGLPLYVVATSTFGTTGGYIIPGLLMGLLQLGWVAVIGSVAADFIMKGIHQTSHGLFIAIAIVWIYGLGWIAIKGIHHVARVAKILNWVPLIMIVVVFLHNSAGISNYRPSDSQPMTAFVNMLTVVIGYFATAGAAGTDFGMSNRSDKDIALGGIFGIVFGAVIAGGLPLLSVAGYLGSGGGPGSFDYTATVASVGALAPLMFLLFALASFVPTCFSSFIASNSFATMIPQVSRKTSTLVGLTISVVMAVTGVANNLVGFFGIVGASFAPICGAMAADYLLAGRKWSGPVAGINWAGCIAWLIGFLVGVADKITIIPASWVKMDNPASFYSFAVAFAIYLLLRPVTRKNANATQVI